MYDETTSIDGHITGGSKGTGGASPSPLNFPPKKIVTYDIHF
jgi:hypothetical protein